MSMSCFIYNPLADKKIQRLFYIFNHIVFFRCGEIRHYFPLHILYCMRPVAKLTLRVHACNVKPNVLYRQWFNNNFTYLVCR